MAFFGSFFKKNSPQDGKLAELLALACPEYGPLNAIEFLWGDRIRVEMEKECYLHIFFEEIRGFLIDSSQIYYGYGLELCLRGGWQYHWHDREQLEGKMGGRFPRAAYHFTSKDWDDGYGEWIHIFCDRVDYETVPKMTPASKRDPADGRNFYRTYMDVPKMNELLAAANPRFTRIVSMEFRPATLDALSQMYLVLEAEDECRLLMYFTQVGEMDIYLSDYSDARFSLRITPRESFMYSGERYFRVENADGNRIAFTCADCEFVIIEK